MAENSKIEWTTHTFNPWTGCTKVSPGCKYCYAEALMDQRYHKVKWGPQGIRLRTSVSNWRKPLQWNKTQWFQCPGCGWSGPEKDMLLDGCPNLICHAVCVPARQRVFVASLADIGEIHETILDEWRIDLVNLVTECNNLDWLFLTKRPENFNELYLDLFGGQLPDNLWVGTSVENNKTAGERIPQLLKIDAKVRFLSCEPLLEQMFIGFDIWFDQEYYEGRIGKPRDGIARQYKDLIHWVIVGGESGPKARPMHPKWATSIRDECVSAGVPFLFKQWGEFVPWIPRDGNPGNHPIQHVRLDGLKYEPGDFTSPLQSMIKIGKHAAGRLLDGRTWDEYPTS